MDYLLERLAQLAVFKHLESLPKCRFDIVSHLPSVLAVELEETHLALLKGRAKLDPGRDSLLELFQIDALPMILEEIACLEVEYEISVVEVDVLYRTSTDDSTPWAGLDRFPNLIEMPAVHCRHSRHRKDMAFCYRVWRTWLRMPLRTLLRSFHSAVLFEKALRLLWSQSMATYTSLRVEDCFPRTSPSHRFNR
jgi:hypothetical protein